MSDERLRDLERKWRASGVDSDLFAVVGEAQRVGRAEEYIRPVVRYLEGVVGPVHDSLTGTGSAWWGSDQRISRFEFGWGGINGMVRLVKKCYDSLPIERRSIVGRMPGFFIEVPAGESASGIARLAILGARRGDIDALTELSPHAVSLLLYREGGNPLMKRVAESGLPIEELDAFEMHSSSEGVREIAASDMPLRHVYLPYQRMTDSDIGLIAGRKPFLESLNAGCGPLVSDEAVYALADGCPRLRNLMLGRTSVTDSGVERLAQKLPLRYLNIAETQITTRSIDILIESGVRLEMLKLDGVRLRQAAIDRLYTSDMPLYDLQLPRRLQNANKERFADRAKAYGLQEIAVERASRKRKKK